MRRIILSLALSALATSAATAGTLTPIFTQVTAVSNFPAATERDRGPISAFVDATTSPSTAKADLTSGTIRTYTENNEFFTSHGMAGQLFVRFEYSGAPVTVPQDAFTMSTTAALLRDLGSGVGPEVGITTVNTSFFVNDLGTLRTVDVRTVREPVFDADNNIIGFTDNVDVPRNNSTSFGPDTVRSETIGAANVSITFGSTAFVLEDGDTFEVQASFEGSQSSGMGLGSGGSMIVDSRSTAQLGFVLPAGVSLVTQPGENFSWVQGQTTVIPLPAGAWLLLAGLGALGALRRRG